jgi:DNA-directed RNA polymerase subunit RPC12/RpoP
VSTVPPDAPIFETDDEPQPQTAAVESKDESGTGRKFPCPGCGAKLDFNPGQRELKCPYCGYAEKIDPSSQEVRERDWEEYWAGANSRTATIAGRSSEVQCKACAAVVLLEDKVSTDRCPYCGNDLENKPVSAKGMILPEGLLPFKIDRKKVIEAFNQWIAGRWFAPSDLKQLMNLGRLSGVYVPFWTFDSMTNTNYTGQRGDNYQEIETYTEPETYFTTDGQGNQVAQTRMVTKTRTVTRIRWSYAAGHVEHFFDDVLVCASKSIPDDLIQQLTPWDVHNVEPFKPEFLAGFQTERYTVDLKDGFGLAQGIMDGEIRVLCCRDIGGDHQQLSTVNTQHSAITFKHILQPVWLAPYHYRDKVYRIVVNARTGEVVGTRPYSFWKPVLLVLAILLVIGLIAGIAALVGAFKNAHGRNGHPHRPGASEVQVAAVTVTRPNERDCHSLAFRLQPRPFDNRHALKRQNPRLLSMVRMQPDFCSDRGAG